MTRLQVQGTYAMDARWYAATATDDDDDDVANGKCLQMFVNICSHKINHIFASFRLQTPHTYVDQMPKTDW